MKQNKIILITAILVMIIAIIIAIVMAGSREVLVDRVSELEILNRKYLIENSCLQAKNRDLDRAVSKLNAATLELQGRITILTEKILKISPRIGSILNLTIDGVWCSRVPGYLYNIRDEFLEWYQWVQENMKLK